MIFCFNPHNTWHIVCYIISKQSNKHREIIDERWYWSHQQFEARWILIRTGFYCFIILFLWKWILTLKKKKKKKKSHIVHQINVVFTEITTNKRLKIIYRVQGPISSTTEPSLDWYEWFSLKIKKKKWYGNINFNMSFKYIS